MKFLRSMLAAGILAVMLASVGGAALDDPVIPFGFPRCCHPELPD